MNKVRIGNNVNVRWKVYNSNGSLYPIIGKIVGLYVSSASLEKVIDTYEIESRNELSFSLLAGELTRYGTYKLVLRLREGDSETEDATYDLVQMFQIVSKSYPERPNILDGEVNIEFSSVLNNLIVDRVEGMSAYEVAVAQGFTGTVSEWLASLQGEPGNDGSFWATYGTTKSVEIAAAIESGRSVFCNWNSLIYRLDKISFSQSSIYTFHVNSDAYQNSLTCQDDVWSHDEVKMATDAQVDEKTSVFFATYNSTTWQEINEAVTAGDAVFLKKDEDIYPLVGDGGVTPKLWEFAFVDTDLYHHRAVCHNDDTWQSTTKSLATVIDLADKQDVISDLSAIRAGATLGATAYQKPSTGIPASDMASGVIPDISGKQDTLVSGSNIKTINGTSILGSGNIVVQTEITMDNVPTSGSNNPVKSGGLYTELAEKIGSQDIDNVVELTLTQYNALATKDARTMYIVSDSAIPSDHVGVASLVQTTTSTADGGINVWTCTLTNGQSFTLQVRNGNQGNSGYTGAAGELEIVNNLTQGGATAALSAEMGKTLEGEISQLGLKQNYIPNTRIDNYGVIEEYEGAIMTSDFIPLANGDTVRWVYSNAGAFPVGFSEYDAQKNYIGTWWGNNAPKERTFTIAHANTAYFRASFKGSGDYEPMVVVNGTTVWTKEDDSSLFTKVKEITSPISDDVNFIYKKYNLEYFQVTRTAYMDLGGAAIGQKLTPLVANSASWTYEDITVLPGEKLVLTTKGNTANAKSYAILDKGNIVLAFWQSSVTDLVITMPDNAARFITNSTIGNGKLLRVLGKLSIIQEDAQQSANVLKDQGYNIAFGDGSNGNDGNTSLVHTAVVETKGARYAAFVTNRPLPDNCVYAYGWAVTSSKEDIGTINRYSKWAAGAGKVDYNKNQRDNVIDLSSYVGVVGVSFTIGEYNTATDTLNVLRLRDFANYVNAIICSQNMEALIAKMTSGSTGVVDRNFGREIDLLAMCRDQKLTTSPFKDIQFLICTDSHADNVAVNNAVSATNGFSSIDAFIHCGDITGAGSNEPDVITNFQQALARLEKPGYVVVGNHDVGNAVYVGRCFSHAQTYNAFIKPMVDKGWLASGEYTANLPYWFHDNATYKVRLIGIYEYDDALALFDSAYWEPVTYDSSATEFAFSHSYAVGDIVKCGTYTDNCFRCKSAVTTPANYYTDVNKLPRYIVQRGQRVIRETQANWFLNTLASTPAGYGVIVLMHNPFSDAAETIECKFSQNHGVMGSQYSQNNMATDFIADAIAAFKNGTSYSANVAMKGNAAYMNTQGGGTYAYSVSKDFSTKNAGAYVLGILGGHSHRDLVFKKGTLYQITPVCAITERGNSMNSDISRTQEDGLCKDSLTVASFSANRIALCKIGVNVTDTGKARDFEVLNTAE